MYNINNLDENNVIDKGFRLSTAPMIDWRRGLKISNQINTIRHVLKSIV